MCKKIDLSNFTSLDCSDGPDPDTQNDRCDFSGNGTSSARHSTRTTLRSRATSSDRRVATTKSGFLDSESKPEPLGCID